MWCLCVPAWPREVPTLGWPWPKKNLRPGETRGTQDSSLIPRTPLAQSVVLETGPQPTPSTAIFAFTPASLRRASYHRSCQEKNLCQLWSGEAGPRPSTPAAQPPSGIPEQLRLWPLPHPHPHPVLQPAHLSYSLHITGMCVLLAPLLFARPLLVGFCFLVG